MCAYYENTEQYTFFSDGSPFSLEYPGGFTIDSVKYASVLQFVLHKQALLTQDKDLANRIMDTDGPASLKSKDQHNGAVSARDDLKDLVYQGSEAKFTQNPALLDILFRTKPTVLVFASPTDEIWGTGLALDDPLIQDKGNWEGLNWLGEILTKLREDMQNKQSVL